MTDSRARSLALARSVSEFGNSFRFIAFPIGVLRVASDPKHLATAELLETVSAILAGVLVPAFIDRFPKRTNLVLSDVLSLLVTLAGGVGVYLNSLPILLASAFAMAGIFVFHDSSLSAATADLTEGTSEASLIRGFSQLQVFSLVAGFIGSVCGTSFVKEFPLHWLFIADGLTFIVSSIWVYSLIPARSVGRLAKSPVRSESFWQRTFGLAIAEWKEGMQVAFGDIRTRRLIGAQAVVAIGHGLLVSSIISHYKTTLKVSDSMVAVAQANNRVWSFVGALVRLRVSWTPRKSLLLGGALMTLGYAAMSISPFFLFLVAYGFQQFGNAILTPTNRAVIMGNVRSDARGRVAAFRGLVIDGGILIGNSLALLVIASSGTSLNFLFAGLALAAATVTYARVVPKN